MPPSTSSRLFFGTYLALFALCAIHPHDRVVWWAENLPILLLVGVVAVVQRFHHFSPLSYGLMFCLVALHTIGGHYTFERVPFGFVTDLFGFQRNHYDRLAHFTVGFYAFPLAEILQRRALVNSRWLLYLFPLFAIMSLAAAYELFEWAYALSADPDAGLAVLGSQGDQWDAQKDMLADTLGALVALALFRGIGPRSRPPVGLLALALLGIGLSGCSDAGEDASVHRLGKDHDLSELTCVMEA